jgi:hypothetical protein
MKIRGNGAPPSRGAEYAHVRDWGAALLCGGSMAEVSVDRDIFTVLRILG